MARWPTALLICAMLGASVPVRADDRKWELEFVGGAVFPSSASSGDVALPPANSSVSGISPLAARIVTSWYFGDGASQLNQALASQLTLFRVNLSLIPLDELLKSRFAERGVGPSIGFRVSRVLTPRFSAEFTFEAASTKLRLESASISGLEASRLSFIGALNGLLPSLAGAQSVTSVLTTEDNRGRQLTTTGALLVNLTDRGRLVPYVAAGGGVIDSGDRNPSAHLVGHYHLVFPPAVPPIPLPVLNIDETDTVTIRSTVENRFAFVIGGGVKYSMNERFSLRLDVRDLIHSSAQRTELDAAPMTVPNSTSGLILGTVPMIAFGSSPIVRSTLSGGAINRFETFHGTGVNHQIHAVGGLIWRF